MNERDRSICVCYFQYILLCSLKTKTNARNTKKKGKNKKEIKTAKTIMLKVRAARAARIFVTFI